MENPKIVYRVNLDTHLELERIRQTLGYSLALNAALALVLITFTLSL